MSGKTSRSIPSPRLLDGASNTESPRWSGYGEPYVIPFGPRVAADEGSYRVFLSPTPGTGVAGHAAPTTMDNTKPFVMLQAGADRRVYLDYIKLVVTAAGTAGSLNYATHLLDSGAGFTSGGGDLTASNPNGEGTASTGLLMAKAGAVLATAGGSQRTVAHQRVRTVIPVVGDVLLFTFGGAPIVTGAVLEGITEVERVVHCPPVIIAPSQYYKLVLWRASQSAAASYECEIGLWER